MALPETGPMSMGMIRDFLYPNQPIAPISLDLVEVRGLALKEEDDSLISLNDFYGRILANEFTITIEEWPAIGLLDRPIDSIVSGVDEIPLARGFTIANCPYVNASHLPLPYGTQLGEITVDKYRTFPIEAMGIGHAYNNFPFGPEFDVFIFQLSGSFARGMFSKITVTNEAETVAQDVFLRNTNGFYQVVADPEGLVSAHTQMLMPPAGGFNGFGGNANFPDFPIGSKMKVRVYW